MKTAIRLEGRIDKAPADERARLLPELASIIDEGFDVLESVQALLIERELIDAPFEGDASSILEGGERFFYCLDSEDGSLIWKQTLPGGWV